MWSCGEYEQKNPRYTKGFFVLFVFRVLVFGISFADRGAAVFCLGIMADSPKN